MASRMHPPTVTADRTTQMYRNKERSDDTNPDSWDIEYSPRIQLIAAMTPESEQWAGTSPYHNTRVLPPQQGFISVYPYPDSLYPPAPVPSQYQSTPIPEYQMPVSMSYTGTQPTNHITASSPFAPRYYGYIPYVEQAAGHEQGLENPTIGHGYSNPLLYQPSATNSIPSASQAIFNATHTSCVDCHGSLPSFSPSSKFPGKTPDRIVSCKGPPTPESSSRSPCPHCERTYIQPRELAAHMTAEHDRPTEFVCTHQLNSSLSAKQCPYSTWRLGLFKRHHTRQHSECHAVQGGANLTSICRRDRHSFRPTRVWGCWYCVWVTSDVRLWAKHHIKQHKNRPREDMTVTWLIKSLLSQDHLREMWQNKVNRIKESTGCGWNFQWSQHLDDNAHGELIRDLETGYWGNLDFHTISRAQQDVVRSAMNAAIKTRINARK